MDANKRKTTQAVIKRTLDNLEKNRFKAVYVNTKEEAQKLISTLIPEGSYTASGGSMTLVETGIMDYIKEHTDYHKEYMDAYAADYYLVSANAITEHGELYEVDGRSNRVSAMLFGPKNVIVVAGINKPHNLAGGCTVGSKKFFEAFHLHPIDAVAFLGDRHHSLASGILSVSCHGLMQ